ncbi:MAG TPA: thymidine kinase [Candidatus Coprosoma intestinipullorum]|uniref:Thymidine kinase n=1 Tax=Candidatus Coprosoma intestinipullorum TaxID=2840752 RepID=A0A9D0ZS32_9FIRM|nr:thymidine kinase [Candidatus Coprosoma intestinipullorum]
MAKLHFKYATMNAGKSIDLMRTAYNYEENGFKVLVMKPKVDTKSGDRISSRVGLERKVDILIDMEDNIIHLLKGKLDDLYCIFVDEAQFLKEFQVNDLYKVSKLCDIPVICYGLRVNFLGNSFEGSRRLLEISDVLEELPTICSCGSIARMVGRWFDGKFVLDGDEVVIDGTRNVKYIPLCGKCYLEKVLGINRW